jgi:hypothetical protein|tara:strand:- start:228 stop:398 length:171 start_codon:yes stop_codon:yes gene_type:complete
MKDPSKEKALKEFFSHFYDVCTSIEASNYTMDEFYDDFPKETHDFLSEFSNFTKKG